jgi:hypothetical protein
MLIKEEFLVELRENCTTRAHFKICALATAYAGLQEEIQTLRSVYETQLKKTA